MSFDDNDHTIKELMRFIEMTSREFIFGDATRNGGAPNYKCRWLMGPNMIHGPTDQKTVSQHPDRF